MKTYAHLRYLAEFFLEWEMMQTDVIEKTKTHNLCSVTFPENRTVYEVMWKNMVESDRPQATSYYGACALHAG